MAAQLHGSSRPVCFLLRLPPSVRRRIYQHLGVARWDGLPMSFHLDGPVNRPNQLAFRGLLGSCRVIYSEASALLFSSNRFVIHYSPLRGHGNDVEPSLLPLRNLTASSLSALANLKIVLSQTSCHHRREEEEFGQCCDDIRYNGSRDAGYCRNHHANHHDRPLRSSDSMTGPMLDEWIETANYLSSRISPGTLRLSLVCDLDQEEADTDTITRIVAPLSLLPELKDCDVRLCKSPDAELTKIARNAALQACRRPEPSPSSTGPRLLDLPRELRLQVLEYTDLVAPWKEVMWTRLQRGYQHPAEGCYPQDSCPCPSDYPWHYGCQFRGCYHQVRILIDTDDELEIYNGSIGCFCRVRHAAFSSAFACRCWAPPTPLFLICRALSEDAKFVFFSFNRFLVSDSLSFNPCTTFSVDGRYPEMADYREAQPPRCYPAERFAASEFLRAVVPADCLPYLRFLELIFPPYNHNCWPSDEHPALQDWRETINWVKTKIRTPAMTLRLTMAGSLSHRPPQPDSRREVSQGEGDNVLAGYDRILEPLACLGGEDGLAQFYADFAWPWKWTSWASETRRAMNRDTAREWTKSRENVLNERAERLILGGRYEWLSTNEGRLEERPWKEQHYISD
ncbi:hypothetical protein F5144DRAFT_506277 [Chaetomium tenue]|uniref:Uncharacterized protein n=1 Tax=Chaetomium tenue TaxID=1854479 RepID=A0ACB7PGY6_9PEZI|nr:hypothetical protein F5144DRAFT_506277 [Chaetomium globosum]